MDKGLDVRGLDATDISRRMEKYVSAHFKGFKLSGGNSLFQENYVLDFTEVKAMIPQEYHHLFKDTDLFNGASGFMEHDSQTYIIMLLSDENHATAYLLTMQWTDKTGKENTVIIGDFLCS